MSTMRSRSWSSSARWVVAMRAATTSRTRTPRRMHPRDEAVEWPKGKDDDRRPDSRDQPLTRPRGHADRGDRPQAGGGGQTTNRGPVLENRSRAQETDTRHDLGGDPRWVDGR